MKITVHALTKSGTGFTRRALVVRVSEAAAEQGKTFEVKTVDGALRYIVDGAPYTPGAAAELLGVPA